MPSFEVWDILKVPFPYTDRPVRQRRPARPISPVQRSMLIAIRSLPGSALVDDPARPVLFLIEGNIGFVVPTWRGMAYKMPHLAHWIEDKWELLRVGAPLRIGPTATFALGVYHRWEPGQVFVIVTTYGDESGTHDGPDGSPIMMLAGWVATLGQWDHFDIGWDRAIVRAGLPGYFHATEHWDTEAGQKFTPLATKLQKKHMLFGYVIELDKESYDKHYIAGNRPRKPQLDTRYSLCFRFCWRFY